MFDALSILAAVTEPLDLTEQLLHEAAAECIPECGSIWASPNSGRLVHSNSAGPRERYKELQQRRNAAAQPRTELGKPALRIAVRTLAEERYTMASAYKAGVTQQRW